MTMAQTIVALGELYLAAGLIVGIAFLLVGLDRVDPAARGGLFVSGRCCCQDWSCYGPSSSNAGMR